MRRGALVGAIVVMAAAGAYAGGRTIGFTRDLAREFDLATTLTTFTPRPEATIVFDRGGRPVFSFFVEQRIAVPLEQISPRMTDAILAVEDRRFFQHRGVDPIRIAGAAWRNARAGRIAEGGSTITQQLARALQLSPVRTYERKIREAMIALRIEQRYSKREVLAQYLNTVYFGEGYHGVEAASRGYFGKPASQLETAEAALLAALVRSPSTDSPSASPKRAAARRNLVLRLMRAQGKISDAELRDASRAPLPTHDSRADTLVIAGNQGDTGLYFQEEVRRRLFSTFGADRVLREGLRVYTTYDPALQAAAEAAITSRVAQISRKNRRARDLQGSLVAMDAATGDVLALVGGRDFHASSFNRATQARRQAGSAFKPIIYAAALERGWAPGSMLRDLDTPIGAAEGLWLPGGGHEEPESTLRDALRLSSNRAAAQLLQQVGLGTAVYYAHRLGIDSELPLVPSLALGTGEVTLLELTAAYTAFANRGTVAQPRLITRVTDKEGRVVWEAPVRRRQAVSPTTAFLMSSMLADVVSAGTATGARAAGFRLPAAGKTGTTDAYADAWFVGYTPHVVAGVWFGLDVPAPIMSGGFASVVAVPAWAEFMRAATLGDKPDWYSTPRDVQTVAICRLTGKRATEACRHAPPDDPALAPVATAGFGPAPSALRRTTKAEPMVYEDLFPLGTAPDEVCPLHGAAVASAADVAGGAVADAEILPRGGGAVRPAGADVVIDRIPRAPGVTAIVIRHPR